MKSRKHIMFLLIGLAVFVISAIMAVIYYYDDKIEIDCLLSEVPDTQMRFGLELSLFFGVFFTIGALGTELSFIRSVYKILKYKPNKWIRICYIISAFLAFLAGVFYCLATFKIFNFVSVNGHDYTGDIHLFTLWPSFIVSFALGSIPIRHAQHVIDQNNNNIVTI